MQTLLRAKNSLKTGNSILNAGVRSFTQNSLLAGLNPERNNVSRVMSTPQWPVPYYQRQFRHDPRPSDDNDFMTLDGFFLNLADEDVVIAKELLKTKGQGYVVEAVENHYDIKDYKTKFTDSGQFSEAYIEDLSACLDLVSR